MPGQVVALNAHALIPLCRREILLMIYTKLLKNSERMEAGRFLEESTWAAKLPDELSIISFAAEMLSRQGAVNRRQISIDLAIQMLIHKPRKPFLNEIEFSA